MRKTTARLIMIPAVILLLFLRFSCAAAGGFTCEYVPKAEKGSLFYIDVCSSVEVRAAVMELRFDDSMVEYREVSAAGKTASVHAVCDGGCVKFAFADSGPVAGRLCRVAFKALRTGDCAFRLHISQAADAQPKLIGDLSDFTLAVKLGRSDVTSDGSVKTSAKTSRAAEEGSSTSLLYPAETPEDDPDAELPEGGIVDLRQDHALRYILIGAGSVILIAVLVFAGFLLGRKTAERKSRASEESSGE